MRRWMIAISSGSQTTYKPWIAQPTRKVVKDGANASDPRGERGHGGREQQHLLVAERSPSRASNGTQRARDDQLRGLEPVDVGVADGEVVGDVAEDRGVVALQDAAGELDQTRKPTIVARPVHGAAGGGLVVSASVVMRGSLSIRCVYQRTPSSEVVDADVLVVAVDGLALRLGHPERGEAVDLLADRGEVARVGGGHHHVGRRDRVGEDARRSSGSSSSNGLVHRARPGSARRVDHVDADRVVVDRLRTCSSAPATVSPTMTRMLTAGAWRSTRSRCAPGEPESVVTATVVRIMAAGSGRRGEQRPGHQRLQPVGAGEQRAQRQRHVRREAGEHLERRLGSGAGNGAFSRRRMARAMRAVGPTGRGRRGVPAATLGDAARAWWCPSR